MGKYGPLERAQLANKIEGFRTAEKMEKKINTGYVTLLSGIPWNILRVTCIFSVCTRTFR